MAARRQSQPFGNAKGMSGFTAQWDKAGIGFEVMREGH